LSRYASVNVVPINFGLKYSPPKIGLEYILASHPDNILVYEIPLSAYVAPGASYDIESAVKSIFELHKSHVNPKVVSFRQVARLVERVFARCQRTEGNKENSSGINQPSSTLITELPQTKSSSSLNFPNLNT